MGSSKKPKKMEQKQAKTYVRMEGHIEKTFPYNERLMVSGSITTFVGKLAICVIQTRFG